MKRLAAIFVLILAANLGAQEQGITPDQLAFFETKIRPVLSDSCYECHSRKSGRNEGGLTLDSKAGLRQGGNSGPGIIPYKVDQSWIWIAMSHSDADYTMPPDSKKIPENIIEDFETWIKMGAPDPRTAGVTSVTSSINIEQGRKFWAFQAPQQKPPPVIDDSKWSGSEIDRFVFDQLNKQGLSPSPIAKPSVLLRRVYFDLIGLPPSATEIKSFEKQSAADPDRALETVIDDLLGRQQFGERWGRHWLDVARYAESNGRQSNKAYPNAWRYRNYVIDSLNRDKPFDRFIKEQIAGDLLKTQSDSQWQEGLIATGFLALGPKELREKSVRQFNADMIDEQIDTTFKAFLGLTVACARCHDHKSDPIPTADYYALAGIFQSSETFFGLSGSGNAKYASGLLELPVQPRSTERISDREVEQIEQRLKEIQTILAEFRESKQAKANGSDSTNSQSKRRSPKVVRNEQEALLKKLDSRANDGAIKEYLMGMQDAQVAQIADTPILVRGEIDSPAQTVPRGFLQVMKHSGNSIPADHSGRIELANWIASEKNPLAARVAVNRVWGKLFGNGIVGTPDNFGTTGLRPTHPELLDHLALEFIENDWSTKKLIRTIMMSRTYRASSQYDQQNYQIDPENKRLWRMSPRRLDAEAIRDSILAITGQLILDRPVKSVVSELGDVEYGRKSSPRPNTNHPPYRSVYLPAIREGMHEIIGLFDGSDPNVVTGKRDSTTNAGQALFLINSQFILDSADGLAAELVAEHAGLMQQVNQAFLRIHGRLPKEAELKSTVAYFKKFVIEKSDSSKSGLEQEFLSSVCQALISSAEFRFVN